MLTKRSIYTVMKSLIAAYIITGILLLFTALLLYKLEPEQSLVSVGILVIYVLSSFLGGLLAGKSLRTRKFVWGLATGALYFMMLLLASWMFGGGVRSQISEVITTMVLCLSGGTLGGMLA